MSTDGLLEARRLIEQERQARTGFLDLGTLGLRELPDELFALDHLTSLNLGSGYRDDRGQYRKSSNTLAPNSIAALPPAIERLRRLETLSLGNLGLTSLESLRFSPNLVSLDCLGNSDIADLSPLSGLHALTSLFCSGTQVTDLSPLSGLTALTSLDCRGTQVTEGCYDADQAKRAPRL